MRPESSGRDPQAHDLRNPLMLLALGFGSGLLPKAPGTWGTVVGVGLYAAIMPFGIEALAVVTLMVTATGFPICGVAARRLGVHDHGAIVWDEIAGVLITLLFVPFDWTWMLVAFVAFRVFDVLKPWPISRLDREVGGGLGIMLDDVLAGLAAGLLLYGLGWLLPGITG